MTYKYAYTNDPEDDTHHDDYVPPDWPGTDE